MDSWLEVYDFLVRQIKNAQLASDCYAQDAARLRRENQILRERLQAAVDEADWSAILKAIELECEPGWNLSIKKGKIEIK